MAFLMERCGEMVVSMEPQKSVPAPFLTKTYQLVDDAATNHIVSWGGDDTTFVVWRPPEFSRDLLPSYFKHNNFSSFVRQLNTYGFRKIAADRWEFANEFFRKGEKHLLSEIHRRKAPQMHQHFNHHNFHEPPPFQYPEDMSSWGVEPPLSPPPPSGAANFFSALSEDNQRLRRKNSLLLSELTHMKKLYNDIIYFLQNHVAPVPPDQRSLLNPRPCKIIDLDPPEQPLPLSGLQSYKNQDSSSCSMAISEEPDSTIKLFGVPLHGKKRLHPGMGGHEFQNPSL